MTVNTSESHLNDPLFQSAMHNLQIGNWKDGLDALNQLIENYPFSHELRSLRQEMQLRARIDEDEMSDQATAKRESRKTNSVRFVALVISIALLLWAVSMYSSWIQGQLTKASQQFESDVHAVEMAVKFRNGQNLMLAGRFDEAATLFQEIAAINADYPGLDTTLQQIEKTLTLEEKYVQAMHLTNSNDLAAALSILESIKKEDPYFKDVAIRINEINNQFFLADLSAQAEKAYSSEKWEQAVSGYETIRAINPQYNPDLMETRLLDSYMNAALAALKVDSTSFDALETAEVYYRKALALSPQDPNVLVERERTRQMFRESLSHSYVEAALGALGKQTDSISALQEAEEYFRKAFALTPNNPEVESQYKLAQSYLLAQDEFSIGHYDATIEILSPLYEEKPEYASGTARQTLYEAHISRGNTFMAGGEYLLALNDYQRAAAIAENNPQSILSLYSAKIKVAEAKGALTDYEDAVFIYQDAIELIDLSLIKDQEFQPILNKLEEADSLADYRYFRQAYRLYKDAAPLVLTNISSIIHIVESEDYLTSLANRYQTTVEAIVKVNNLTSPKQIQVGKELLIPATQP